jgi:hypothetical protein
MLKSKVMNQVQDLAQHDSPIFFAFNPKIF